MGYVRALPGRFAWLVVLTVTLAISAYSLYFVARHLGVPRLFAAGMSTAFDGVALLSAHYSLEYAKAGNSGTAPNLAVYLFAGLSAWLNSLHAVLGGESPLAIPMWASLPVAAVVVFEIHTSFERRKALARQGVAYPAALPKFGGWSWVLWPGQTMHDVKTIVKARAGALAAANAAQTAGPAPKPAKLPNQAVRRPPNRPPNVVNIGRAHPSQVRAWAKGQPVFAGRIGDRARIPADVWAAYEQAAGGSP